MNKATLASVMVLTLILMTCHTKPELTPEETTLISVGQIAPGFELETLDGETFNLEEQRGKVVLVNFFATWCPPCREELPYLDKDIWQRFQTEEFALLVVGREEGDEILREYAEKNGHTFPIAGDLDRSVYSLYASQFIPRNYVVGPDGTVLFQSQGFEMEEFQKMVGVIEEALSQIEAPEAQAA